LQEKIGPDSIRAIDSGGRETISATMTAVVSHVLLNALIPWSAAVSCAAAIAAAAFGWGRLALAPFDRTMDGPRLDRRLTTLAIGAGVLALLVFAAGVSGQLYRPVLLGLLLAGATGWLLKRTAQTQPSEGCPAQADHTFIRLAVAGGRALALAFIAFGVLMPEFFHDAVIYHLELPRYYLFHHRMSFLPWNYNSALPANVESLYLIALAFSDERAAKLIHAAFALLCAAALGSLGRHIAPRAESSELSGLLAGALFLLTPSVPLLAGVSGNDLGLLFFELMSLLAWHRWRMAAFNPQGAPPGASPSNGSGAWLICSGALMGLAIGTKYSASFFLAGMTAAWGVLLGMEWTHRRRLLRAFGGWLLMAVTTGSPWLLKNFLTTGDPLYPTFAARLGHSFLDGTGVAWLQHDLGAGGIDPTAWPDYLPKLAANDIGWLTLAAASLTAAVALSRPRFRSVRPLLAPLLALIAVSAATWWFASPVPRYLLPTTALLGLVGAVGLADLAAWSSAGRATRVAAGIIVTIGLAGQLSGAAGLIRDNYLAPFTALTGLRALEPGQTGMSTEKMASSMLELVPDGEARQQWLAWSVPPYAAIEAANRLLPPAAVVLFVGEYRGYYLDRDRIISTKYETSPLVYWAGRSGNVLELEGWLIREGVTHLLYNQVEARRLEQMGYPALRWPDQASRERFEQLRRERLTLLTVQNGVFLYAVGPPSSPASTVTPAPTPP
jgi:hypothetical protein